MSDTAQTQDLIRRIASDHGVVLDPDDPILIVQSATQHVLVEALQQARKDQEEVLGEHRTALEALSGRWQRDAANLMRACSAELMRVSRTSIEEALSTAIAPAVGKLSRSLGAHERSLTRASIACVLAVAVSVLSAGVALAVVGLAGATP